MLEHGKKSFMKNRTKEQVCPRTRFVKVVVKNYAIRLKKKENGSKKFLINHKVSSCLLQIFGSETDTLLKLHTWYTDTHKCLV